MQEKIEFFSLSQRPELNSTKYSGDLSFAAMLQNKSLGWQIAEILLFMGAIHHPVAGGLCLTCPRNIVMNLWLGVEG